MPELLARAEAQHTLRALPPFPNLSINYVAPAIRSDGRRCVLKLCFPDREVSSEAAALRAFDGNGAARLLAFEPSLGVLVLEAILPGRDLRSLPERAAARTASALAARLHSAPGSEGLIPLRRWLRSLLESDRFPEARAEAERLLRSSPAPVVLHGDLHHRNVLLGEEWRAIDPKGLWGDPAFDGVMWLANSSAAPRQLAAIWGAALGCDLERVLRWSLVQHVLSACWSIESGADPGPDLTAAEKIRAALCSSAGE